MKGGNEGMLADHTWEVPGEGMCLVPRDKTRDQGSFILRYEDLNIIIGYKRSSLL